MWDGLVLLIDEVVHGIKRVWSLVIPPLGLTERAHKVIELYTLLVVTVHFLCSNQSHSHGLGYEIESQCRPRLPRYY